MQWPIHNILDEKKSYSELLDKLHDGALRCAKCGGSNYYRHSAYRDGIDKHRCRDCKHVFHIFSGTVFSGTTMKCSKILMILRGFVKGQSTRSLALELNMDRKHLLDLRHKVQNNAFNNRRQTALADPVTETDECYQNAGEKGIKHPDPDDPPRRRANKKREPVTSLTTGRGSWER